MIISKTPFRMSFFGGGTDFEEFFVKYGGAVLSTTFDKYCYVTVRQLPPFFEYSSELVYAKTERVTATEQIEHPAIRNAMQMLGVHNLRLSYEGDLPARSGLGTSSSFSVGMLNALYRFQGHKVSKAILARDAIYLERTLCREAGGWQDQIAVAYGGFNRIQFKEGAFDVQPIEFPHGRKQLLDQNLMLFFTGFTRFSADIQKANETERRQKTEQLFDLMALVNEAEKILIEENSDIDNFGRLLDTGWRLKRQIGKGVSTSEIDDIYQKAIQAGALGGKLLGAGGGGFMLFYVPLEYQQDVKTALRGLIYIPFHFEENGTQIIYCTQDD